MPLAIKSLNGDASFLLSFSSNRAGEPTDRNTFTILTDPWLGGSSKVFHYRFSKTTQKTSPCISTLREIEEPDLVIISQPKTDHCHEGTLRSLPASGGKTKILASPAAAKMIRGWKYFDPEKVIALQPWQDLRVASASIYRIQLPVTTPDGAAGEVTVAWIPEKKDITQLHGAVGITYRASSVDEPIACFPLTPPASPRSITSIFTGSAREPTLSVIYSPHGCSYKTLQPYASQHLVHESALPLTALLHCFDRISNPWWLGGNICTGFPGGLDIAQNLMVRTWISTHDAEKVVTGVGTTRLMTEKYGREEVEEVVSPKSEKFPRQCTDVIVMRSGEEVSVVGRAY